ncbi:hypothetical protein Acr_00g0096310 [Actinidia rufa]|uniref:Reverse transcriptase Ty1/copia-type domain-containing protein n=1 Tax=Actinidia rufa TaxID=165716 RepID=A0A7J0DZQ7_9ERIC|nr:hypothetical protein Acr_00g0096310 [Actinidia rufa]
MNDELPALAKTHTWELIPLSSGKNFIGCKWVYKVKTHSDGSLERYKARLVSKDFSQESEIDYDETFALVAKINIVRVLIFVVTTQQWSLFQLDVKNAFLNGSLSEKVFMRPPSSLSSSPILVCCLLWALYGLKQSTCAWYECFQFLVLGIGIQSSAHNSALFIRHTSTGIVLVLLYVDDMIIIGLGLMLSLFPRLNNIYLSKYSNEIIGRAQLIDDKVVDTLIELHAKFSPTGGVPLDDPTVLRILLKKKKQFVVARSTAETEYRTIAHAIAEVVWLHWLLADMGIFVTSHAPLCIQIQRQDIDWRRLRNLQVCSTAGEAMY